MEEFFKIADDLILPLWMNKARTIELNPRKIPNDPILPNPAVRKNCSEKSLRICGPIWAKFVYDSILPLWMNQAKTIWKNPLTDLQMTDPILPL